MIISSSAWKISHLLLGQSPERVPDTGFGSLRKPTRHDGEALMLSGGTERGRERAGGVERDSESCCSPQQRKWCERALIQSMGVHIFKENIPTPLEHLLSLVV
ncbi:unnamed protein product [Hapterophycus canaliculatus]